MAGRRTTAFLWIVIVLVIFQASSGSKTHGLARPLRGLDADLQLNRDAFAKLLKPVPIASSENGSGVPAPSFVSLGIRSACARYKSSTRMGSAISAAAKLRGGTHFGPGHPPIFVSCEESLTVYEQNLLNAQIARSSDPIVSAPPVASPHALDPRHVPRNSRFILDDAAEEEPSQEFRGGDPTFPGAPRPVSSPRKRGWVP